MAVATERQPDPASYGYAGQPFGWHESEDINNRVNVGRLERWLSLAVGGALAAYAVKRRTAMSGTAALAFCVTAEDGSRHVYFCTNAGGRFGAPVPRTEGSVVDKMPKLALDLDGNAHVVWERELPEEGEPSRVFYLDTTAGEPKEVATGSAPSVFIDHAGRVHLAYARAEGIYYTSGRGGEFDSLAPYVPGDPPQAVDWNAYARTGQLAVRRYVPERRRHIMLACDAGRLMGTRVGGLHGLQAVVAQGVVIGVGDGAWEDGGQL